jgi:hypothetical protein
LLKFHATPTRGATDDWRWNPLCPGIVNVLAHGVAGIEKPFGSAAPA